RWLTTRTTLATVSTSRLRAHRDGERLRDRRGERPHVVFPARTIGELPAAIPPGTGEVFHRHAVARLEGQEVISEARSLGGRFVGVTLVRSATRQDHRNA